MPTLSHTDSNAAQCQLHGSQPQKNYFNSIASRFPTFNPADISQTTQRAFKGKILSGLGQTIQFAGVSQNELRPHPSAEIHGQKLFFPHRSVQR
jgi:hypothetical protein